MKQQYSDECLFCAKYLFENGLNGEKIEKMRPETEKLQVSFSLNKIQKNYWTELAEGLRGLWPPGEKDGKYPWRDSVKNLARRLELMWTTRMPQKNYTKDQVLLVARRYLSQFQESTKYMKLLKYFILKTESTPSANGILVYTNHSTLADMLETADEQGWFAELNTDIPGDITFVEEGELI